MEYSLIVGLGNPGEEYQGTRHNVGFWLLDQLREHWGCPEWDKKKKLKACVSKLERDDESLLLVKPLDYMNNSGKVIRKVADFVGGVEPERVVVVFDDAGIEFGKIKVSQEGGDGGHNGLKDIFAHFGKAVTRFRVGVGQERLENGMRGHVLGKFTPEERSVLTSGAEAFITNVKFLIENGPIMGMNRINERKNRQIIKDQEDSDEPKL